MKSLLLIPFLLVTTACASGIVIPKENGIYETVSEDAEKEETIKRVIRSAKNTCKDLGLTHVIQDMETTFHGKIIPNEKASNIVMRYTGGAAVTNQDYKTIATFKCKSTT